MDDREKLEYKEPRGLDGFYLRVKRGDRYVNRCFSDLTEEEQDNWLARLSDEGLRRMCKGLAEALRRLGDEFDIMAVSAGEDD